MLLHAVLSKILYQDCDIERDKPNRVHSWQGPWSRADVRITYDVILFFIFSTAIILFLVIFLMYVLFFSFWYLKICLHVQYWRIWWNKAESGASVKRQTSRIHIVAFFSSIQSIHVNFNWKINQLYRWFKVWTFTCSFVLILNPNYNHFVLKLI